MYRYIDEALRSHDTKMSRRSIDRHTESRIIARQLANRTLFSHKRHSPQTTTTKYTDIQRTVVVVDGAPLHAEAVFRMNTV